MGISNNIVHTGRNRWIFQWRHRRPVIWGESSPPFCLHLPHPSPTVGLVPGCKYCKIKYTSLVSHCKNKHILVTLCIYCKNRHILITLCKYCKNKHILVTLCKYCKNKHILVTLCKNTVTINTFSFFQKVICNPLYSRCKYSRSILF